MKLYLLARLAVVHQHQYSAMEPLEHLKSVDLFDFSISFQPPDVPGLVFLILVIALVVIAV